jgi:hypothetical protein
MLLQRRIRLAQTCLHTACKVALWDTRRELGVCSIAGIVFQFRYFFRDGNVDSRVLCRICGKRPYTLSVALHRQHAVSYSRDSGFVGFFVDLFLQVGGGLFQIFGIRFLIDQLSQPYQDLAFSVVLDTHITPPLWCRSLSWSAFPSL